jgi:diaminopropionate ammonia-lyase
MRPINNPHRGGTEADPTRAFLSTNAARVANLLSRCPAAKETPLIDAEGLAPVARLWVKDERPRHIFYCRQASAALQAGSELLRC